MAQLTFQPLRERVRKSLDEGSVPERLGSESAAELALEVLAAHYPIPDAERRIDADLLKKDTFYAVPDEALDLLPSLAKAAFEAIVGNAVGALPELVGILYRYRNLKIELDVDEASVIRSLRSAKKAGRGPLAPAEIRDAIKDNGLKLRRPLSDVLGSLRNKQTEKVTLAREVNGRWTTGNV